MGLMTVGWIKKFKKIGTPWSDKIHYNVRDKLGNCKRLLCASKVERFKILSLSGFQGCDHQLTDLRHPGGHPRALWGRRASQESKGTHGRPTDSWNWTFYRC